MEQNQAVPAGTQIPGKYPRTGPNYAQFGEQPGLVYDYARDAYFVDPNSYEETYGEYLPEEPEQPGLAETLLPIAGTVGALGVGRYVGNDLIPGLLEDGASEIIPGAAQNIAGSGVSETVLGSAPTEAITSASPTAGASQGVAGLASGQPGTFLQGNVGPIADGAQFADDIGANSGGLYGLSPVATGALGAAGLGLGAKGVYDAFESGDPLGGAISGAGGGLGASMLSSAMGLGALGPWGWGAGLAIGLGAGLLGGHKSTDEYKQERWRDVLENTTGADRALAETFANKAVNNLDAYGNPGEPVFKEGPLAGRDWRWDEVKNVAEPGDIWGSLGFFQAFPNWISEFTEEERYKIAQAALDEDLLISEKGSVYFPGENQNQIRSIAGQVKDGSYNFKKSQKQREQERAAYLQGLGVDPSVQSVNRLEQYLGAASASGVAPQSQNAEGEQTMNYQNRGGGNGPGMPGEGGLIGPERMNTNTATPQASALSQVQYDNAVGRVPGQASPFDRLYEAAQSGSLNAPSFDVNQLVPQSMQEKSLTPYYEGAPPGEYLAPDGINRVRVQPDGVAISTLIGAPQPGKALPGMYGNKF